MTDKTKTSTTEPAIMPIQTKHLAIRFGMKATALRRILRSMPAYADGVHTNYRWSENDPRIAEIGKAIANAAKRKQDAAIAARAALQARIDATAKQAKVDATLTKA